MTTAGPVGAARAWWWWHRSERRESATEYDKRQLALAAVAAAWTLAFLRPEAMWGWLAAPLCVVAMLILHSRPMLATAAVVAASEVSALAGVPYGEVETLLPTFVVLAHLGRMHRPVGIGIVAVLAFVATTAQRSTEPVTALLTGLVVYGTTWGFGLVVRRRAAAAVDASRRAQLAAELDLERLASESAAAERHRLTNGLIDGFRDALAEVARQARLARPPRPRAGGGGPATDDEAAARLARIHRLADETLARLHRELDTLAGPEAHPDSSRSAGPPARAGTPMSATMSGRLTGWMLALRRVAAVPAGMVAMVALSALLGGAVTRPAYLVPALLLPVAAATARRRPLMAGILTATAFGVAALDAPHPAPPLLPSGAAISLICFLLAVDVDFPLATVTGETGESDLEAIDAGDAWRHRIGLLVAVVGTLGLAVGHGRTAMAYVMLVIVAAVGGALGWAQRDRILQREEARGARLMANAAHARLGAQRDERRRLARELHDIVSHAVVGISLQAQVAQLEGRDGGARLSALQLILGAATTARAQLDGLSRRVKARTQRQLDDLLASASMMGLDLTSQIDASDAGQELVYMVLREGITNAARHAPGAHVVIRTRVEDSWCEVTVTSSGPRAAGPAPSPGRGSGLRGLHERVAAAGGTFEARPAADGFLVTARFPLPAGTGGATSRGTSGVGLGVGVVDAGPVEGAEASRQRNNRAATDGTGTGMHKIGADTTKTAEASRQRNTDGTGSGALKIGAGAVDGVGVGGRR